MPYLKGEDINLGIARESSRGTPEAPQVWLPGRTPSGVTVIAEKSQIRETRGTGMSSQGSVINQIRAEGDHEFNVRNGSFGFLLLSLLGKVTTLQDGQAYRHTFEVLTGNAQYPSLTLALSQLGQQDYRYAKSMVTNLEVRTPVDDLVNATATFVGCNEEKVGDYSPAFPTADYFFRHYDVTIKQAATVAGLASAPAMKLKELSFTINNNGRVNQNISELNPGDVLALMLEIQGSMKIDYDGENHHDIYVNNTYRAMSIKLERTDITIDAGESGPVGDVHPSIEFIFPKTSYTTHTPDRTIDDITTTDIEFMAHYDESEGKGISVVLVNDIANYN